MAHISVSRLLLLVVLLVVVPLVVLCLCVRVEICNITCTPAGVRILLHNLERTTR